MSIGQQPIQLLGFYVAGLLCLGSAVLKLTLEGHWSWWRVLLPLWTVLGHNILYSGRLHLAVLRLAWPARRRRHHDPGRCSAALRIRGHAVLPAVRQSIPII